MIDRWRIPIESRWLPLAIATLSMAASALFGQGPKIAAPAVDLPRPDLKVKFHQDLRGGDPGNPNIRLIRDEHIRWEAEGARITMPAGKGRIPTTGVAGNFKIKGDFEITASYEILHAEAPTEGYGVGVSLYMAIDSEAGLALSLARRLGVKGNAQFVSDRMTPNPEKGGPAHFIRTRPAQATTGKLRVQRVGADIRFLCAEGGSEFVPIVQNVKAKGIQTPFGAGDIRYFQIGADAGQSEATLDVRLLDLTVEAEGLPGLIEVKKDVPAWILHPRKTKQAGPSRVKLIAYLVGGGAGIAGAAGLVWLLWFRRRAAARAEEEVAAPAPTVSFACAKCRKKLRAKLKLAGKTINCPGCRAGVLVPQPDAVEAD